MVKIKKTRLEKLEEQQHIIKKEKRKNLLMKLLIIFLLLITLFLIYAHFIETNILVIHEHRINNDKVSESFDGYKILHFTDLHFGKGVNKRNLKNIVNKFNESKPDIVVFTGDLIDEDYKMTKDDRKILVNYLNSINATLGKYAVLGNHDVNNSDVAKILEESGFILLKNAYDLIYKKDSNPLMIYGVDNVSIGEPNTEALNDNRFKDYYKIVLVHEGDFADYISDEEGDLILSGHSHNGQINIPKLKNLVLPKGSKKYYKSYYKVNNNDLYVSNGIGCSVLSLRFFSFPSYNLYRIEK